MSPSRREASPDARAPLGDLARSSAGGATPARPLELAPRPGAHPEPSSAGGTTREKDRQHSRSGDGAARSSPGGSPEPRRRRGAGRVREIGIDPGRWLYRGVNTLIVGFLLAPIAVVAVFAVNPTPFIQFPPVGVSFRWFQKFLASRDFMAAIRLSFGVAVLVALLATVLGATAALGLTRGRLPGARLLTASFLSPLMLPAILTGLALFQLYVLLDVGRPLWGLVAGHVLIAVPYVIRTTLAVLHHFDRGLEEAARNLGASPARAFFEVTLPLIRPGVVAGALFAFIVSFDQFPVSLFLVSPGRETLPITLFNYLKYDLDGTIAAASMVSILLAVAVVLVLDRLVGLRAYVQL